MTTPPSTPKQSDHSDPSAYVQGGTITQCLAQEQANEAAAAAQCLEHERTTARDVALARALEADQEATATAKERDDAALHASDALVHAAMERAATAAALEPEPSGAAPGGASAPSRGMPTPTDLRAAMLHHENVALLQLHSQVVAVSNIRNHVTTVLDVDSGNFNC
jgi:hypothetical protein